MLGWDRYGFQKKHAETRYIELVIFYLVGYVGHVVHSSAFGVRNVDALFFMLGGSGAVSIKSTSGHVTPNLCFYIRWDLWDT
jgi:mannose-6-phosphate isomerase-like protein (cupin superfamily)